MQMVPLARMVLRALWFERGALCPLVLRAWVRPPARAVTLGPQRLAGRLVLAGSRERLSRLAHFEARQVLAVFEGSVVTRVRLLGWSIGQAGAHPAS